VFLDFLRQLNAADGNGRRLESLEPEHRPDPLLDPAVVLLNQVIQILAGPDAHALRQRANLLPVWAPLGASTSK